MWETVMSTQQYAISTWPNADEIMAKANELVSQPPWVIKPDKMEAVLGYFETKCAASKKSTEEAAGLIPGGVQHNLAFNFPFPLNIRKAEGAYLWDVDDNRYIDFLQAGGPTLLGSNYPAVREQVVGLLNECGPVTGLFHDYELKLAQVINKHMPAVEMFRMLGSGSEGVMAAIRLSRNFTEKSHIIKVGGGYHGWSDQVVLGLRIPGTGPFEASGIPEGCLQFTHEFYPNDVDALRALLEQNASDGGTAAVIVEPLGPESGTRPVRREFNQQVRELCDEFGSLLIFDEVVTGFRVGLSGAQGYFDVKPDLTVFGKCVAGGYPAAGGLGGRADIMSGLAAGIGSGTQRTLVGGTLSANPLSCAAGYYSILEIEKTNAPVLAGQAGDRLCQGLQAIIDKHSLPFLVFNHGSIVHLETAAVLMVDMSDPDFMFKAMQRKELAKAYGAAYTAEGIISLAGSRLYTSMADTDEVVDDALARFEEVLQNTEPMDMD
ncbi:MAG: aminotransferase class III-fold pyridoxal phosphate-dependent enzyme [bacterium]|nr:aminotransferase class III-fold pyridoxal phosphate-dependent enzyme [bacterium]